MKRFLFPVIFAFLLLTACASTKSIGEGGSITPAVDPGEATPLKKSYQASKEAIWPVILENLGAYRVWKKDLEKGVVITHWLYSKNKEGKIRSLALIGVPRSNEKSRYTIKVTEEAEGVSVTVYPLALRLSAVAGWKTMTPPTDLARALFEKLDTLHSHKAGQGAE